MKRFLLAAFKITPFQMVVIASFSTLKYVLNTYNLITKIQKPFIWTCLGVGILFVIALSIYGIKENERESSKNLPTKPMPAKLTKHLNVFINLGISVPTFIGYALFLYLLAPRTWLMLIALLCGIFIGNISRFFSTRKSLLNQEAT